MAPLSPAAQRLTGLGVVLEPPEGGHLEDVLGRTVAAAVAAERAGCSSVWVGEPSARAPDTVPYEAYSLLGALACRTARAHLGALATGHERRAPSVLAKIVTGVDVISRGRSVLSLDGDRSRPDDATRLAEALAVCRAVLEDEHPTVAGRIYSVTDAVNRPSPVQAGGVPLVVFLDGPGPEDAVLEVCAEAADAVVVAGGAGPVGDAVRLVEGRTRRRTRSGDRVAVLGRVPAEAASTGAAAVRDAGGDGCLVDVPAPWPAELIAGLAPEA